MKKRLVLKKWVKDTLLVIGILAFTVIGSLIISQRNKEIDNGTVKNIPSVAMVEHANK